MTPDPVLRDRIEQVSVIMRAFGARTGLTTEVPPPRYLWTDAFAVCNLLALHHHTGAAEWLADAERLIAQVHHVLGQHRPDDVRTGWISGLDEATGVLHPTAGGLRIGKPLPERRPSEPPDDRIDWDRDGQYYHYLTRWLHALERAAAATGDAEMLRHGVELAKAAHAAFAYRIAGPHGEQRLYWKMSVDLSRPVVYSMGQHDALDGLVATAALAAALKQHPIAGRGTELTLDVELAELAAMCEGGSWATADALGIGGMLVAAWSLAQLVDLVPGGGESLLTRVLRAARRSLDVVTTGHYLDGAAHERLPFRELGLSLGLAAVERLAEFGRTQLLPGHPQTTTELQALLRHMPLRARLEAFWTLPAHQRAATWSEHEDINAVMLATSLLPDGFLGNPLPAVLRPPPATR